MSSIRRILAATDLSSPARHATQRAALLAHEHGAELTLEHVVDQGALATLDVLLETAHTGKADSLLEIAERQVEELATALQRKYQVAPVRRIDTGRVLKAMLTAIQDVDPDLLVMGARGQGFVRHMLLGSTPERILTRTRKPILVVRQQPHATYERILVAVDFSARSQASIATAHALAPNATIVALHVHQIPFEGRLHSAGLSSEAIAELRQKVADKAQTDMQALVDKCKQAGITVTPLLESGDPSHRILEHEHDHDCDLIVLGKHSHDPLGDVAVGSVARHVLTHAQGDILVVDHSEG